MQIQSSVDVKVKLIQNMDVLDDWKSLKQKHARTQADLFQCLFALNLWETAGET